ncbi:MAG: hypothetical protein AAB734_04655 [Patescibacteria group bacterium]
MEIALYVFGAKKEDAAGSCGVGNWIGRFPPKMLLLLGRSRCRWSLREMGVHEPVPLAHPFDFVDVRQIPRREWAVAMRWLGARILHPFFLQCEKRTRALL